MSPSSTRFVGFAARIAAGKRRIDLVRMLLRRMDAASAPRHVPPRRVHRDASGRSLPPR